MRLGTHKLLPSRMQHPSVLASSLPLLSYDAKSTSVRLVVPVIVLLLFLNFSGYSVQLSNVTAITTGALLRLAFAPHYAFMKTPVLYIDDVAGDPSVKPAVVVLRVTPLLVIGTIFCLVDLDGVVDMRRSSSCVSGFGALLSIFILGGLVIYRRFFPAYQTIYFHFFGPISSAAGAFLFFTLDLLAHLCGIDIPARSSAMTKTKYDKPSSMDTPLTDVATFRSVISASDVAMPCHYPRLLERKIHNTNVPQGAIKDVEASPEVGTDQYINVAAALEKLHRNLISRNEMSRSPSYLDGAEPGCSQVRTDGSQDTRHDDAQADGCAVINAQELTCPHLANIPLDLNDRVALPVAPGGFSTVQPNTHMEIRNMPCTSFEATITYPEVQEFQKIVTQDAIRQSIGTMSIIAMEAKLYITGAPGCSKDTKTHVAGEKSNIDQSSIQSDITRGGICTVGCMATEDPVASKNLISGSSTSLTATYIAYANEGAEYHHLQEKPGLDDRSLDIVHANGYTSVNASVNGTEISSEAYCHTETTLNAVMPKVKHVNAAPNNPDQDPGLSVPDDVGLTRTQVYTRIEGRSSLSNFSEFGALDILPLTKAMAGIPENEGNRNSIHESLPFRVIHGPTSGSNTSADTFEENWEQINAIDSSSPGFAAGFAEDPRDDGSSGVRSMSNMTLGPFFEYSVVRLNRSDAGRVLSFDQDIPDHLRATSPEYIAAESKVSLCDDLVTLANAADPSPWGTTPVTRNSFCQQLTHPQVLLNKRRPSRQLHYQKFSSFGSRGIGFNAGITTPKNPFHQDGMGAMPFTVLGRKEREKY